MQPKSSLTDLQLLSLIKDGDHAAFTEIYNRYWSIMYVHALKMLRDEDEAKDLVQELFTSFWTKGGDIEIKSNLAGYLYIAIRHKILNHIRHRKISDDFISLLSAYMEQHQDSIIENLNQKELAAALDQEILLLPEKMRHIFELSRKQELSHKEIALELAISDKTVKKQISNALKIIRLRIDNIAIFGIIFYFFNK